MGSRQRRNKIYRSARGRLKNSPLRAASGRPGLVPPARRVHRSECRSLAVRSRMDGGRDRSLPRGAAGLRRELRHAAGAAVAPRRTGGSSIRSRRSWGGRRRAHPSPGASSSERGKGCAPTGSPIPGWWRPTSIPAAPLAGREMLLDIKALGFHFLNPVRVRQVLAGDRGGQGPAPRFGPARCRDTSSAGSSASSSSRSTPAAGSASGSRTTGPTATSPRGGAGWDSPFSAASPGCYGPGWPSAAFRRMAPDRRRVFVPAPGWFRGYDGGTGGPSRRASDGLPAGDRDGGSRGDAGSMAAPALVSDRLSHEEGPPGRAHRLHEPAEHGPRIQDPGCGRGGGRQDPGFRTGP